MFSAAAMLGHPDSACRNVFRGLPVSAWHAMGLTGNPGAGQLAMSLLNAAAWEVQLLVDGTPT